MFGSDALSASCERRMRESQGVKGSVKRIQGVAEVGLWMRRSRGDARPERSLTAAQNRSV